MGILAIAAATAMTATAAATAATAAAAATATAPATAAERATVAADRRPDISNPIFWSWDARVWVGSMVWGQDPEVT